MKFIFLSVLGLAASASYQPLYAPWQCPQNVSYAEYFAPVSDYDADVTELGFVAYAQGNDVRGILLGKLSTFVIHSHNQVCTDIHVSLFPEAPNHAYVAYQCPGVFLQIVELERLTVDSVALTSYPVSNLVALKRGVQFEYEGIGHLAYSNGSVFSYPITPALCGPYNCSGQGYTGHILSDRVDFLDANCSVAKNITQNFTVACDIIQNGANVDGSASTDFLTLISRINGTATDDVSFLGGDAKYAGVPGKNAFLLRTVITLQTSACNLTATPPLSNLTYVSPTTSPTVLEYFPFYPGGCAAGAYGGGTSFLYPTNCTDSKKYSGMRNATAYQRNHVLEEFCVSAWLGQVPTYFSTDDSYVTFLQGEVQANFRGFAYNFTSFFPFTPVGVPTGEWADLAAACVSITDHNATSYLIKVSAFVGKNQSVSWSSHYFVYYSENGTLPFNSSDQNLRVMSDYLVRMDTYTKYGAYDAYTALLQGSGQVTLPTIIQPERTAYWQFGNFEWKNYTLDATFFVLTSNVTYLFLDGAPVVTGQQIQGSELTNMVSGCDTFTFKAANSYGTSLEEKTVKLCAANFTTVIGTLKLGQNLTFNLTGDAISFLTVQGTSGTLYDATCSVPLVRNTYYFTSDFCYKADSANSNAFGSVDVFYVDGYSIGFSVTNPVTLSSPSPIFGLENQPLQLQATVTDTFGARPHTFTVTKNPLYGTLSSSLVYTPNQDFFNAMNNSFVDLLGVSFGVGADQVKFRAYPGGVEATVDIYTNAVSSDDFLVLAQDLYGVLGKAYSSNAHYVDLDEDTVIVTLIANSTNGRLSLLTPITFTPDTCVAEYAIAKCTSIAITGVPSVVDGFLQKLKVTMDSEGTVTYQVTKGFTVKVFTQKFTSQKDPSVNVVLIVFQSIVLCVLSGAILVNLAKFRTRRLKAK